MKILFLIFSLAFTISCDSNNSSGEDVNYKFQINEMNYEGDIVICTASGSASSKSSICSQIYEEFDSGDCDRACAVMAYSSAGCGDLGLELDGNMSCNNKYSEATD